MTHHPKPTINWKRTLRASIVAALVAAVVVVNTPAQSSYAVSWGGCSGNCAGKALPPPPCDTTIQVCTKTEANTVNTSDIQAP